MSLHKGFVDVIERKLDQILKQVTVCKGHLTQDFFRIEFKELCDVIQKTFKKELSYFAPLGMLLDVIESIIINENESSKRELFKAETSEVKRMFISILESLPQSYAVYVGLGFYEKEFETIKINDDLIICQIKKDDPLLEYEEDSWASGWSKFSLREENVYLRFNFSGYLKHNNDCKRVGEFVSQIKRVLYLGLLTGAITESKRAKALMFTGNRFPRVMFHNQTDESEKKIDSIQLSSEVSEHLSILHINQELREKPKGIAAILKQNETNQEVEFCSWEESYKDFIDYSRIMFEVGSKKFSGLQNALLWGFNSICTQDDNLRFLQETIAIEAFFGKSIHQANLDKTLADRVAFYLGGSQEKRDLFRERFTKYYTARSKIIHGEEANLDTSDTDYDGWFRKVLDYSLRKEFRHLKNPELAG